MKLRRLLAIAALVAIQAAAQGLPALAPPALARPILAPPAIELGGGTERAVPVGSPGSP